MNIVSLVVDQLNINLNAFKAVSRCLLNTILFQRVLEKVCPKEVSCPELEIDYVCNPRLEEEVEKELDSLRGLLRKKKFIQLTVSFYFTVKEGGWFSSAERVEWERWTIPIRLDSSVESSVKVQNLAKDRLQSILLQSDRHNTHLLSGDKVSFRIYDASESKGWTFADLADLIKKGPPGFS
jgi:hypothetical protein